MTHSFRSSFVTFVALALSACSPAAPIGASDDAGPRADAPADAPADTPIIDAPVTDAPVIDTPRVDVPLTDAPADRPDACANAVATSDICCNVAMAEGICTEVRRGGRPCHVCVQRVDSMGNPRIWSAVESPAECGCGAPSVDPPVDAGASCTSNADCARGQVCEYELGCAQRGVCHDDGCQSLPVAPQYCGCDGRTIQQVSACLPDRPYRAMGACPDAGAPDGGLPAGAECADGGVCAAGLLCCYPCGIPGCTNRCTAPMAGRCPLIP